MKATVQDTYGGTEVLALREIVGGCAPLPDSAEDLLAGAGILLGLAVIAVIALS